MLKNPNVFFNSKILIKIRLNDNTPNKKQLINKHKHNMQKNTLFI